MRFEFPLALAAVLVISASACSKNEPETVTQSADAGADPVAEAPDMAPNPFLEESELYFSFPRFDRIADEHYAPAFELGMAEHMAEIEAIAGQEEAPTLDNTVIPLERSGAMLDRVSRVFFAMASAHTNDVIEEVRSEMAPKLSAHRDRILLNEDLFARVKALYDQRDSMELDPESYRLIGEYYKDFVRAGALLSGEDKETLKALNAELASRQTSFSQNVLNEVNELAIVVDSVEELAGLSEEAIAAAKLAAEEREMPGKYVLPLLNTSGQPSLSSLENRALRQRIHETSLSRGSRGGEFDNRENLTRIARIRAERAQLLGYEDHAHYGLERTTAGTREAVNERLASLAPAAVANARREEADLQDMVDSEGGNFELASWDWDYYTEKVRKARYDFDASQLRPYFELDSVLNNGVFFAAEKVYGLTFKERTDEFPVYQEDVRVWEVFDADGSTLAMFIGDFYARSSKRGGAWMNAYVSQSNLLG
ncbi:MAG: dipeptidyl carboxypeptidase II, partial [Xanthomonadales bacterium]|nr:M3 family metallopeptidase [Xanthomonadales bacterium]NIX11892.1 dipeptidyl carboxypeptidase II [Xanthomonadales bacterium]